MGEEIMIEEYIKDMYGITKKSYSKIRGSFQNLIRKENSTQNIYHASIQKTASQWIKAIFNDQRIKKHTNLFTYPQHRYEWDDFHKKFPKYTFVSGLYIL
jgi:endonuclease III-like uncharacterized protein